MPFKSVKQRKYLWANKPEVARKWTKKYGKKIKSNALRSAQKTSRNSSKRR